MNEILEKLNSMEAKMDYRFESIDRRFESIDQKFESIDRRFESIDQKFESIDRRFESIDQKFESIDRRFDELEININRSMDEKLEYWDKKRDKSRDALEAALLGQIYAVEERLTVNLGGKIDRLAEIVENQNKELREHSKRLDWTEMSITYLADKSRSHEKRILGLEGLRTS